MRAFGTEGKARVTKGLPTISEYASFLRVCVRQARPPKNSWSVPGQLALVT